MDAVKLGELLWNTPEPGFFELETHKILLACFRELGYSVEEFCDFPGMVASSGGDISQKPLFLISDMDALPNPSNGEATYIHSCGHHQQMVALVETARLVAELGGDLLDRVAFLAIPGEEYIELPRRRALKEEGKISFLSGKLELLHRGYFAHSPYVVSTHSASPRGSCFINSVLKMSGFKVVSFRFVGQSAHAGAQPHRGINAQSAASLFLQASALLRERVIEEAHVRFHPIITLPENQSVNLIPATAYGETYVRAASSEEVENWVEKLATAAEGCAKAVGARVEVDVQPGYAPFEAAPQLHTLAGRVAEREGVLFTEEEYSSASSDVGDISQCTPTIMLGLPGSNGKFHSPDFQILDPDTAFRFPGKYIASYLLELLEHARKKKTKWR